MKTIDGKDYTMVVFNRNSSYVAPSVVTSPLFLFKSASAQTPNVLPSVSFPGFDTITIQKPFLPLYCTQLVYVNGEIIYSFATPYLVGISILPSLSSTVPPIARQAAFASKIAPYCKEDFWDLKAPTGNNQRKQFIGNITFPRYEQIPFSANDFIWDDPCMVVPTDTQYNYLNYFGAGPQAGVPQTRNNTSWLSYTVAVGDVVNQRTTVFYLSLL